MGDMQLLDIVAGTSREFFTLGPKPRLLGFLVPGRGGQISFRTAEKRRHVHEKESVN
jgi:hypothetical protein